MPSFHRVCAGARARNQNSKLILTFVCFLFAVFRALNAEFENQLLAYDILQHYVSLPSEKKEKYLVKVARYMMSAIEKFYEGADQLLMGGIIEPFIMLPNAFLDIYVPTMTEQQGELQRRSFDAAQSFVEGLINRLQNVPNADQIVKIRKDTKKRAKQIAAKLSREV